MARHFVAVCVVCLLCADHLPCKTHFEGLSAQSAAAAKGAGHYYEGALPNANDHSVAAQQPQQMDNLSNVRWKRHAIQLRGSEGPEAGTHKMNENSRRYIMKMFSTFGNGDAMDLNGFESMLDHLGLTTLFVRDDVSGGGGDAGGKEKQDNCMTPAEFVKRVAGVEDMHHTRHEDDGASRLSKREVSGRNLSTSPNELINAGGAEKTSFTGTQTNGTVISSQTTEGAKVPLQIAPETMYHICPILVYHLMSAANDSCLSEADFTHESQSHDLDVHGGQESDRALVWIYASASVLGVSLCGMLGFAVIPCMDKSFYNTMLQFLVALAVGTLAGDALLHLLPHAMILSIETAGATGNAHTAMTCKGLVAVVGVIAFFAIERGLTMIAEWRKERQKKQQLPGRVRVMRDPESVSLNNSEKQCKNKYSSYPYCYDEIAMDTKDDHHHHHHHHGHSHSHGGVEKRPCASISTTSLGTGQSLKQNSVLPLSAKNVVDDLPLAFDHSQLNHHHHQSQEMVRATGGAETVTPTANGNHKSISKMERLNSSGSNNNNLADNNTVSTTLDDGSSIESSRMLKPARPEESYTVILREHESKHHGHSHTHGHVHSPPGSLSAVAWMVVMGDGLHNFTDGMAIGAAFSNNIAGGFSTAIAVFCHELPHELGDFAVLLKAGMSAKKAVYYNFLSSILSFLGMALGICIGDTPEASAWIFAVAAGLFIYIALVDMVPELTSSPHETCAGSNTVLQVTGMCVGLVIMLLIALNEEGLKSLFTDDGHHHHHH